MKRVCETRCRFSKANKRYFHCFQIRKAVWTQNPDFLSTELWLKGGLCDVGKAIGILGDLG